MFGENVALIDARNSEGLSYSLEVNSFADLTWDEFEESFLGANPQETCSATGNHLKTSIPPPPYQDWRSKGVVTPVKVMIVLFAAIASFYSLPASSGYLAHPSCP